jgi:hypothetical protein
MDRHFIEIAGHSDLQLYLRNNIFYSKFNHHKMLVVDLGNNSR